MGGVLVLFFPRQDQRRAPRLRPRHRGTPPHNATTEPVHCYPTKERMNPRVFISLCLLICSCHEAQGFVVRAGGSISTARAGHLTLQEFPVGVNTAVRAGARRPAGRLTMQQTDEEAKKTKLRLRSVVLLFVLCIPPSKRHHV